MTLRPLNNRSLQNYPKIQIDRGSVIKPCVADPETDNHIDKPHSSWKKIIHDIWHNGIPFILRHISDLKVPEFSRCPKWNESVIRAFAWHPNYDRCALAVCNDIIYVYDGPNRIRLLRHNHQRKIVDIAWQPNNKEVLVVATQTHIIIWRISDTQISKDSSKGSNITYLAPGLHFIKRDKESILGATQRNDTTNTDSSMSARLSDNNFKLLRNILPPPIVSIQFDQSSEKLYACSPNSSRIAVLDISKIFNPNATRSDPKDKEIEYLWRFGQGITKVLWSPQKNRLATAITSSFVRVFEPFSWSCNKWSLQGGIIQDMIWSKPLGRMLLMANKNEPYLYALPFLDSPQANDVGGNKSIMRALDLTATKSEFGDMVGGRIQSTAWDKDGRRLAISFKDNPQYILLYRTVEKPTVEFQQLGMIQSDNGSLPLLLDFHDKFENGSLLTICWSDGNCQHIPLSYGPQEQHARNSIARDDQFDKSFNQSMKKFNDSIQSPRTPKSLTNFCHVSGNNSITSLSTSLLPINKTQHQSTLFSLSPRAPLLENNTFNSTIDD